MQRLQAYRRTRDFERTPEPAGGEATGPERKRFVIRKHLASRLHYDLRLEHGGVLRSWALPKGPGLAPGEKQLAVEVEDHPLEFGGLEGTIPTSAYGGGTVMLWGCGNWTPTGDGVRDDCIDFELAGEKLHGAWTLTRTGSGAGGDDANWLLIKRTDRGESTLEPDDDHSVPTGRTMAQIEQGEETVTEDIGTDLGAIEGSKRANGTARSSCSPATGTTGPIASARSRAPSGGCRCALRGSTARSVRCAHAASAASKRCRRRSPAATPRVCGIRTSTCCTWRTTEDGMLQRLSSPYGWLRACHVG